jgi:selT/selW/selH-like putative selenoprotein
LREAGIAATATPGRTGQFDVLRDGALVFSKAQEHRFPETAEILAALR